MENFFILGFQRSGTTMLRLMLDAHPDISVPHETAFIPEIARLPFAQGALEREDAETIVELIRNYPFVRKGNLLTERGIAAARQATTLPQLIAALFEGHAESRGSRIWGDKSPNQTFEIARLARLFPRARFIHLVRDGRACMLSHKRVDWGTRSPGALSVAWATASLIAEEVGSALGSRFLSLRYEQLIRHPRDELERVAEFLGVPFDPLMLDFHSRAAKEVPSGSMQYHTSAMSPPDPSKSERWLRELSPAEISLFEEYGAIALHRLGYPILNPPLGLSGRFDKLRLLIKHRGTPAWLRPPPYNLPLPDTRPHA
ncbi:sulfotransferase family protein [Qipengyuania gaetbuli]|uniref:sulfotransferase family protein n=1 Tax=Qipengyuania gaetbuli TaxID=266952 RepID=UPI001CFD7F17|nr:sulfotransferase [Qipengyuania gaetbuli]